MGRGIYKGLLEILEVIGDALPDNRHTGRNFRYTLTNAIKSAFAVFFFQYPSLLCFQEKMQAKLRRNNMESIFKVESIPSDPQIRTLLDGIRPERFGPVFNESLRLADEHQVLDSYRVLDGGVLIALDGVWYHLSEKIWCPRCLHKTKGGVTSYYHTILAATIVKPGDTTVLPVMGELIGNDDGQEKQDCEVNAAKRWVSTHAQEYAWLKPTLLGDDLFSHYPMCKAVQDAGMSFIFTCKEESHPWVRETVQNSYLLEKTRREWNGRHHVVYRYRWLNGVDIRDHRETLQVNYVYMEIAHEETGKVTYRNSWVTDKAVSEHNVAHIAACGRSRWKIENEHNNVLKNHGYNLAHNFGHGQEHASEMFCLLNLLGFLWHALLWLADEGYKNARACTRRRDEFFNELRAALRWAFHANWEQLMVSVGPEEPFG